jgi:hypothetical protein
MEKTIISEVSFPHLLITQKHRSRAAFGIFARTHPMPPDWEVFCGIDD